MRLAILLAVGCSSSSPPPAPAGPVPTQGSGEWPKVDCNALFNTELVSRACAPTTGPLRTHDDNTVFDATDDDPRLISLCDRSLKIDGQVLRIGVHGYSTPAVLDDYRARRRARSGYDPVTVLDQGGRRDLEVPVGRVLVLIMESGDGTPFCTNAGLEALAQGMRQQLSAP